MDDKSVYLSKSRIYKTLLREKKELHSLKVEAEIERNIGNSKLFWQNIKILSEKRKLTTSISKDDWYEHFFNVFNLVNINSEEKGNNFVVDIQSNQIVNNQGVLNCIITHGEICTSIENLKKGKSAGPDGLVAEKFICLQHMIVPYLSKLLNDIFNTGVYPDLWTKSIIVPYS